MPLNTQPIKVQTVIPNFNLAGVELKKKFRQYMKEAHLEATALAKTILQDSIRNTDTVAKGNLLKSVSARFVKDTSVSGFSSNIGFIKPASNYAYFANNGRRAGKFPPPNVILAWAKSKGIDERAVYLISKKIAEEGTEGKHFMEDAEPKIQKAFSEAVKRKISIFKGSIK